MRYYIFVCLCILSFTSLSFAKKIEELKYSDGLDPSFFTEFSVDQIAEQLIKRVSKERDQSGGEFDYRNNSDILIAFYEKSLKPILDSGCFYNAHQLQTSNYTFQNLELRENYENKYIDLDLSKNVNPNHQKKLQSLRPKFAFMQHHLKTLSPGKIIHSYGSVFAKARDDVKNRSTFSLGDQEREGGYHHVHTFSHTGKVVDARNKPDSYWEAHIWGELCLNNIEYFLVNCPGFKPISQQSLQLFLNRGMQVFTCRVEDGHFKQDRLIAPSNLNQFKVKPDTTDPKIQDLKISKSEKSGAYDVEFAVADESLSFCEVNLHFDKSIISGDLDLNPHLQQGICKWRFDAVNENLKYVEMIVKDAFGNKQIQTISRVPKISLP